MTRQGKQVVVLRLPVKLHRRLRAAAQRQKVSVNALAQQALARVLNEGGQS